MKVFLIAGEPSGDRLGAALMAGLSSLVDHVEFHGVGGAAMQGAGLASLFAMSDLSVMGIAEVAPKYFHLKRRIRETAQAVMDTRPDVLITIDSPDFCLRVARQVREAGQADLPIVHYVAPSVWAWRPKRAVKMARWVDHVLALLPFEPPYMRDAGMSCDFVGHPVVSEPVATQDQIAGFRAAHGIGDAPLVLALPGSRRGEVTRLADRFAASLAAVKKTRPDLRVVLPVAQGVDALVREKTASWSVKPILIPASDTAGKNAAFGAADVALAASGTVSLELAASATPMVIAYDMNWFSRLVIGRLLRVDTVTLVNLVSGTRVVPEFLGADCRPDKIAPALVALLNDPSVQKAAMRLSMERLGKGYAPPGLRAARSVLSQIPTGG